MSRLNPSRQARPQSFGTSAQRMTSRSLFSGRDLPRPSSLQRSNVFADEESEFGAYRPSLRPPLRSSPREGPSRRLATKDTREVSTRNRSLSSSEEESASKQKTPQKRSEKSAQEEIERLRREAEREAAREAQEVESVARKTLRPPSPSSFVLPPSFQQSSPRARQTRRLLKDLPSTGLSVSSPLIGPLDYEILYQNMGTTEEKIAILRLMYDDYLLKTQNDPPLSETDYYLALADEGFPEDVLQLQSILVKLIKSPEVAKQSFENEDYRIELAERFGEDVALRLGLASSESAELFSARDSEEQPEGEGEVEETDTNILMELTVKQLGEIFERYGVNPNDITITASIATALDMMKNRPISFSYTLIVRRVYELVDGDAAREVEGELAQYIVDEA